MEELIELLIRLISSLFENTGSRQPPRMPQPPGYPTPPPPPSPMPGQIPPPLRPVAGRPALSRPAPQKAAPPRRNIRRVPPIPIAMAQPILTRLAPQPTAAPSFAPPPPTAVARAERVHTLPANQIPTQSAAAIRKWLEPANLKQQFLLTEIFQPPLALRDNPRKPGV